MEFFIGQLPFIKNDSIHFEIHLYLLQIIRKKSGVIDTVTITIC